jgi:tetratricopeptide (TPR) repeat protein
MSANQKTESLPRLAVALALCALFLLGTFLRNPLFENDIVLWSAAILSSPGKQRTHHNYGCALSAAKRYEEAVQAFQDVLALAPDGSVAMDALYIELGNAFYHLERHEEALAAWRKALAASPGNPEVLTNIAVVYFKQGRTDEAEEYVRLAMAVPAPLAETLELMGDIAFQRRDFRAAANYYVAAIRRKPDLLTAYRGAVLAYELAADAVSAQGILSDYLALNLDVNARREAMEIGRRITRHLDARTGVRQ